MQIENSTGLDYSQTVTPVRRLDLKPRYTIVRTGLGWVVIGGSGRGIGYISLPKSSVEVALAGLDCYIPEAIEDASAFGDLPMRLQRYFAGEMIEFPDELDLEGATAFEQVVWEETRHIPYGEVRSYAWVANRIGKPLACRAVGGAMARNRFPIVVPCHRVVASDGSPGGFSGGLDMKKSLLELEDGRISKSSSRFLHKSSPAR